MDPYNDNHWISPKAYWYRVARNLSDPAPPWPCFFERRRPPPRQPPPTPTPSNPNPVLLLQVRRAGATLAINGSMACLLAISAQFTSSVGLIWFSSPAVLDGLFVVVAVHLGFVGSYRICSVDLAASALPLGTDLSCIPTLRYVDRGFVGCIRTCSLGSWLWSVASNASFVSYPLQINLKFDFHVFSGTTSGEKLAFVHGKASA